MLAARRAQRRAHADLARALGDAARRARRRCRPPRAPARRARRPRTGSARSGAPPPTPRAGSSIVATRTIGWSLSTDQIALRERAGASAAASPRARTTSDMRVVGEAPLRGGDVDRVRVGSSASDVCFTSPTTPTMVYGWPSSGPTRSRWPIGSCPRNLRLANDSLISATSGAPARSRSSSSAAAPERDAHRLEVAGAHRVAEGAADRRRVAGRRRLEVHAVLVESPLSGSWLVKRRRRDAGHAAHRLERLREELVARAVVVEAVAGRSAPAS